MRTDIQKDPNDTEHQNIETLIINRRSLRLGENPLYESSNPKNTSVIFFCDAQHAWSPHQKILWLRSMYQHAKSVQKKLLFFMGTSQEFLQALQGILREIPSISKIILDRCDDPHAYDAFDKKLNRVGGATKPQIHFVTTQTLVDWWRPENTREIARIAEKYTYNQFNTFKSMLSGKLGFLESKCSSCRSKRFASANIADIKLKTAKTPKTAKNGDHGWFSFEECKNYIQLFEKDMKREGKEVFDFPKLNQKGLETQVQEYLKQTDGIRRTPEWYKPDTSANASLHTREKETVKMSSKMGPLIALGLVSVHTVYRYWAEFADEKAQPKQGSLLGQLLFREMFHAYAVLPCFWEQNRAKPCWKSYETKAIHGDALRNFKEANTGYTDLDAAIQQLKDTGYIHHLQRHIIADYLTLGKLGYDWKIGEMFFREHLIDHDAASNRGNWLWLSASAFSSKQKVYHYKYEDYIQRHS